MKKTIVLSLMTAALMFCACSSDNDTFANEKTQKKGMKLNAVVPENLRSRATIGDTESDTWTFAFSNGDEAKVTNSNMSSYYTFIKSAEEFGCATAEPIASPANWFAYFPSTEVGLTNQSGSVADVANKFALAGKTSSATTGEEGLTIHMDAKVAVLVIDNQKGAIDINIKNSATTWVTGLAAKENEAKFDITTSTTKASILNKSENGKYYIAVPADVQLAIKNGDEVIKSTVAEGLEAGKYYAIELTDPYNGHEYVDLGLSVKWATMNVGATSPEEYGDYFAWGATEPWYTEGHAYDDPCTNWKEGKTGYDWNSTRYVGVEEASVKFTKYLGSKTSYYKYSSATDLDAEKTVLDPDDDAAHVNWGGTWRTPTHSEQSELYYNCYWVWTTNYGGTGKNGYIVYKAKSPSDKGVKIYDSGTPSSDYTLSDTHIFLPVAGFHTGTAFFDGGSNGYYWSSSIIVGDPFCAYDFILVSSSTQIYRNVRYLGYSIRAVCP